MAKSPADWFDELPAAEKERIAALSRDERFAYPPHVRAAFAVMMTLTEEERGLVLCWFCRYCHRYVGPGDRCQWCENDE